MTTELRSGQVARLAGVSADTLHHYERLGLLPEARRTAGGYRLYDEAAIERLLLIRRALRLGFSLSDLAELFRLRALGEKPCRRALSILELRLEEVTLMLDDLVTLRDDLRSLHHTWSERLSATPDGERAHLLDSLGESKSKTAPPRRLRRRNR